MSAVQSLQGRRLLVTGAASGIGRATAVACAAAGARLALTDVAADGLLATAESIGAWSYQADLLDRSAIWAAVAASAEALGGLDGVVNVAGVPGGAFLADLERDFWDQTMGVNLTAPYEICRAALAHLGPGSSIVNIASGQGLLPSSPGASAYAASKAGLIAFTKALALELAPHIRANVVCPGVVDTPMTRPMLHSQGGEAFLAQYPMKRVAQPAELAAVIVFLLSDAASYMTGSALAVDGGRTLH